MARRERAAADGAQDNKGEYAFAPKTRQLQGAATREEEAKGIRMGDFF
jgi:hypothetical protein